MVLIWMGGGLALIAGAGLAAPEYSVGAEVGSRKVLRDAPFEEIRGSEDIDLEAARNEYEPFQVVVAARDRDLSRVRVTATDLRTEQGAVIPAHHIELRRAHYIQLTEAVKPEFPGGWYPDALLPLEGSFAVSQGHNQAVWANLYVPPEAAPGTYTGAVQVGVDGEITELPVHLRVRDVALPVENHCGSAFAIWGNFLADEYGLEADSPEYRALYERTYWFLVGYRLPPDDLPVPVDSPEAAKYLDDPRVSSFRIPYSPNDPQGFQKRVAHLRQKGWLTKGYIYTIDEPGRDRFRECFDYGKRIDELAPDAQWLLTKEPDPELYGAVDIWCPDLAYIDLERIRERQALGEEVWWYTCIHPQHPFPTYLINDDATSARVMSWLQAAWNIQGVLYWSVNVWGKYTGKQYVDRDVWTDPLAFPGGNGDGYLIYPGKTADDLPIPTLRLEMIRQGNEDFETFWLLEQRLREAAEGLGVPVEDFDPHARVVEIVNRVATGLTQWNRDPAVLESARRLALAEIEEAPQHPRVLLTTSVPDGAVTESADVEGRLWTEPGAIVQGSARAGSRAAIPIPLEPELQAAEGPQRVRFSVSLAEGTNHLILKVRQKGATRTLHRTFARQAAPE